MNSLVVDRRIATGLALYDFVELQFPGRLLERLKLEMHLHSDPYLLRTELLLWNDDRNIHLRIDLEPVEVNGVMLNAKVPEVFILHLCTFLG